MISMQRFSILLALATCLFLSCKTMNRTQKGAVIGAAGGGAVGAVIGRALGNTALGAIIGAAVGGASGAVIGRKMDKQAEEMKKVLGDADVRREGEGIVINFKEKVLFGFDKAVLTGNAQNNLNQLTNILIKYPDTNIEIIGHTDQKGTNAYNKKLSLRRAGAVSTYLESQQVNHARLLTKGMGESDPVASNDTEDGRSLNRRVEFVITANEKMKEEAKRESTE